MREVCATGHAEGRSRESRRPWSCFSSPAGTTRSTRWSRTATRSTTTIARASASTRRTSCRSTTSYGFHPSMAAIKPFWDAGKMAIITGIGYPDPSYSHFRSMDIWYTGEPETIGDRRLARQGGPRDRPEGRERPDGGQLRARPPARAVAGRRAGRVGRPARLVRPADQPVERRGARSRPSKCSPACTTTAGTTWATCRIAQPCAGRTRWAR